MTEQDRVGLDETRRLLYTLAEHALRGTDPSCELVGTIKNSLFHHHPDLRTLVVHEGDVAWCQKMIDKITDRLGDA